jgi:hypothetical protein
MTRSSLDPARTAATASIAGAVSVAAESTASRFPERRCSGSGFGSVSSTMEGCSAAVPQRTAATTKNRSIESPTWYQPCSDPKL